MAEYGFQTCPAEVMSVAENIRNFDEKGYDFVQAIAAPKEQVILVFKR